MKGPSSHSYSENLKREVVRLRLEGSWSYRLLREHFGIKSEAHIAHWLKKVRSGESFEEQRGVWNRNHFSSLEEENEIYTGKSGAKS